ncbi:MAG: hypothetical protein GY789_27090 [Hyphomicrobiales bacterium]|nr:hypothetical protein [Hyphomicrobiales bacterium]
MFGKSKKERTIEALQRGTKAALSGGFFHVQDAEEYGLDEPASAWLYTEALAHQIYVLIVIFNNTLVKKHSWATTQFAIKAINAAITDYEIQVGSTPGSMSAFIFRRCSEIDALPPQARVDGEHFRQSTRKVAEFDSRADQEKIAHRLESVANEFFNNAINMFK